MICFMPTNRCALAPLLLPGNVVVLRRLALLGYNPKSVLTNQGEALVQAVLVEFYLMSSTTTRLFVSRRIATTSNPVRIKAVMVGAIVGVSMGRLGKSFSKFIIFPNSVKLIINDHEKYTIETYVNLL